jgi:cell wall-associated NlpC family hydrolase
MTCVSRSFLSLLAAVGLAAQPALAQYPREASTSMPVRGVVHGEDLVRTARRFLGVPYLLGGTTPRAFDCSGFVRYVFLEHGIAMPRTAHEQVAYGAAPSVRELEPGDLLFFYGGQGAQHVAIYIGRDSIIHASSTGRHVRLDRLAGSYAERTWFGRRLIAVRRILPAEGVFLLQESLQTSAVDPPQPLSTVAASLPH